MVRWSEMPLSTTLPSLSTLPIPYPSYVDLLSPPPHANANGSGERLCQLNCMVNTNRQNETIATEVAILVSLMLNQGPSWPGSRNGYRPALPMLRPLFGPQNWKTNKACSHCCSQKSIPLFRLIPLFWMVLCSSMLLLPSFWMSKFRGVLHELNSNADKNGALMVKGGAFVWKEWARL